MRTTIYARVLGNQQRAEHRMGRQRSESLQWATQLGFVVAADGQFRDDGHLGGRLARPELDRLRELITEGLFEHVSGFSSDRFARDCSHQVFLSEQLRPTGAEVESWRASSEQTWEGQLLVQAQAMIAQYERAQILEHTRGAKRLKALRRVVNVVSGVPYAIGYVPRTDARNAHGGVEPLAAEVGGEIFGWFVDEQWSNGRIARAVTKRGATTRRGKAVWERSTIAGMLRNPAYLERVGFRKLDHASAPRCKQLWVATWQQARGDQTRRVRVPFRSRSTTAGASGIHHTGCRARSQAAGGQGRLVWRGGS